MTDLIGATVEADLDKTLARLLDGDIELYQLTPALKAWYITGYYIGLASHPDIERITRERDMWYACYANGWTPGEYLRRQTDALWDQAVAA